MSKVIVVSSEVEPRLKLNLIARVNIKAGEVVFACSSTEIQRERTWRTIQLNHNKHIKNEFLDYVNHSCDPNTILDIDKLSFVAIREIAEGESVTFFYPGAEVELAQDFLCECRSSSCLGHIKGGIYLTHEQMKWALQRGYCTDFIQQHFLRFLSCSPSFSQLLEAA